MPGALLPPISHETNPFWQGCAENRLLLQCCDSCGQLRYPPAKLCNKCLNDKSRWCEHEGQGIIYSFVVYHHAFHPDFKEKLPYVVAIIELDNGPRMISRITGCEPGQVEIGMPVKVVFEKLAETVSIPIFKPAGGHV